MNIVGKKSISLFKRYLLSACRMSGFRSAGGVVQIKRNKTPAPFRST